MIISRNSCSNTVGLRTVKAVTGRRLASLRFVMADTPPGCDYCQQSYRSCFCLACSHRTSSFFFLRISFASTIPRHRLRLLTYKLTNKLIRRGRDSNPGYLVGTHAFQACRLNHSRTSPKNSQALHFHFHRAAFDLLPSLMLGSPAGMDKSYSALFASLTRPPS